MTVTSLSRVRAIRAAERALKGAHEHAARYPGPTAYYMHGQALKHLQRLKAEGAIIEVPSEACPDVPPSQTRPA